MRYRLTALIILILILFFALYPPVEALNKTTNWDFATNGTGWTVTTNSGTNVCGNNNTNSETAMASVQYNGTVGNPSGAFRAVTGTTSNRNYRGNIRQQFTVPGSGTVKATGRLDYFASSTNWSGTANSGWVRMDIYNSANSTWVANVMCASFNSNQAWTTASF